MTQKIIPSPIFLRFLGFIWMAAAGFNFASALVNEGMWRFLGIILVPLCIWRMFKSFKDYRTLAALKEEIEEDL